MRERGSPTAAEEHRAKTAEEAARIARRLKKAGHPTPLGDPASGVMLVVEPPVGPRVVDALRRSLDSVGLNEAHVFWSSTGLLLEALLAAEPSVLAAIGPEAAREIDDMGYPLVHDMGYPLVRRPFSESAEGEWFSWTAGAAGLRLPPLAPALDDEAAKRRFWRAFLALQELSPAGEMGRT